MLTLPRLQAEPMQDLLDQIAREARPTAAEGRVADYIPALARIDPERFALVVRTVDGQEWATGDADTPFSIQSVSKLFTLALAMEWVEDGLWSRVGREPSGMRFNSLIQLETEGGIPRNPFINAGAIVVTDALVEHRWNFETAFRAQMRLLSGNPALQYDGEVHASEKRTGDLNRAIAYVLKASGNLREDPIAVTDTYFRACSLAMSARDLARAGMFLIAPQDGPAACASGRHAQRLRAIMRTCGLYDQSGEFAYRVGLPGKSGVGGGILVAQPGQFVACAWSPPLDRFGNSVAGQAALEALARHLC
ncbi:MAG: glutaminase [Pseudomonadota bacterium]